jgi:uncharacterized protein YjbI with pentapeptide repeats
MHYNTTFEKKIAPEKKTRNEEFEDCAFIECDFSNASFISCMFTHCTFTRCNLSMVQFSMSQMDHIDFIDCKLLGINFGQCSDFLFSVDFENCVLDYCSFTGKKLSKTSFKNASLKEGDFTGCDLSQSVFENTDLHFTTFKNTNLSSTDFRSARNYQIDPETNTLRKAKFSWPELTGLLYKYEVILE